MFAEKQPKPAKPLFALLTHLISHRPANYFWWGKCDCCLLLAHGWMVGWLGGTVVGCCSPLFCLALVVSAAKLTNLRQHLWLKSWLPTANRQQPTVRRPSGRRLAGLCARWQRGSGLCGGLSHLTCFVVYFCQGWFFHPPAASCCCYCCSS